MTADVKLRGVSVAVESWFSHAFGEPGPELSAAADGTGGFGGIVFEDPDGTMDIVGWTPADIDETDCTAAPRLHTGYVYDREERRGSYTNATGRQIDCTLLDQNAVLSMRLIDGPDGKRPKESDRARLDWLFGSSYLTGLIADLGLVDASTTIIFDAADYRGQYPADIINDLATGRSVIFFAYWDQVEEAVGLFFDFATAITYTSTLSISNVASDVAANPTTCFPPYQDGTLKLDPSLIYSKVRFTRTGGSSVHTNPAIAAEFFPSPILTRGLQITNERVGLLSTASTFANRYMNTHATEAATITCTVRLPSTHVGLIEAGQRLAVRFSHLTGFSDFVWTRVESRQVKQVERKRKLYEVTLTLSTKGLQTGNPGGDPGHFPHQPPGPAEYVQEKGFDGDHIDFDHLQTDGHLMTWFVVSRNYPGVDLTATTPSGWTMLASCYDGTGISTRTAAVYYRIASGEDTHLHQFSGVPGLSMHAIEWADGVSIDTASGQYGSINAQTAPGTLASVSVTPSAISTLVGNLLVGSNDINAIDVVPGSGVTQLWYSAATGFSPRSWVGIKTEQTGASNVPAALTGTNGWGGITYAVHSAGAGEPPDPAQPVPWAVVTMDGADGTTEFPYAAGSLQLRLNGVPISTASYTERDPSCGDFTLSWVPFADDVITASYQGAA